MTNARNGSPLPAIEPGSIAAQALYQVWSGIPGTIVQAPPGAGKTTLLTQVIEQLVTRADMRVAVAAQTRAQGVDIANRLAAALPNSTAVLASSRDKIKTPTGVTLKKPRALHENAMFAENLVKAFAANRSVVVAATAKWCFHQSTGTRTYDFDLLVIDEAWQATNADLHEMAHVAPQVLLVGDPGQISPVVTVDVSRFAGLATAPHHTAPDALLTAHPDLVASLQLTATRRCGPVTAAVLQDLYPFDFTSARPDQHIEVDGQPLPELAVSYTDAASPSDARLFSAVAAQVIALANGTHIIDGQARPIDPARIAVGVAHVHQATAVRARLPEHLAEVTVETAERLQGCEYVAMVALDPMAGMREAAAHNADNGRLCVLLSRATAHTHVVSTPDVVDTLSIDPQDGAALLGAQVRVKVARAAAGL